VGRVDEEVDEQLLYLSAIRVNVNVLRVVVEFHLNVLKCRLLGKDIEHSADGVRQRDVRGTRRRGSGIEQQVYHGGVEAVNLAEDLRDGGLPGIVGGQVIAKNLNRTADSG